MTAEQTETPVVSRACATGNHRRCLGTVYSPTESTLVECQCPVTGPAGERGKGCGHGNDTEKARSRRKR